MKTSGWNFESDMTISETAKNDIVWWIHHAQTCKRKTSYGKVTQELRADASTNGWGTFSESIFTDGRWSLQNVQLHINALDFLAVFLGLKALCSFAIIKCYLVILQQYHISEIWGISFHPL